LVGNGAESLETGFYLFFIFFLKEKLVLLFLKEYNTEKELSHMEDASKGAYPSIYN